MSPVVLYENADVLVVNKPAGLVVHSDGRTEEPTLVDWILEKYPSIKGVCEHGEVERSGIVHRLDRETSGVMAIAKNQKAFVFLKEQFQSRKVEKIYHAFVYGKVKHDEGVIDRPIARSKRGRATWSATRGKKGEEREAITEYRVLGRSQGLSLATKDSPWGKSEAFSFLELHPLTGRTHQLRVHLKAINYPIVCDKLYAQNRVCALGFSRLALHSRSVSFTLPSGKPLMVEAPYPADFLAAKKLLENSNIQAPNYKQ